jgi:AraC family transcriptional regulator
VAQEAGMNTQEAGRKRYGSYAEFYQEVYGDVLREVRPAGRTGAVMMLSEQDSGDWSDAPSPDLVVSVIVRYSPKGRADFGAGPVRQTQFRQGEIAFTPPGTASTIVLEGRHDLRTLAIPYRNLLALAGDRTGLPKDGNFGRLHTTMNRNPEVVQLLDRVWTEARSGSPRGALYADGALLQLASLLMDLRDGPTPGLSTKGLAPWQVRRVREYLSAHLEQDVSLGELAAIVGLSSAHFSRAHKQATGLSPLQSLTAMRLERAKALLADPRLPVIQVALSCGYESPSAFAQVFRRETGMTPTNWRRRLV